VCVWLTLRRFELLEEGEDSVVAIKNKLRRLSTVGYLRTLLKLCALCAKLLRPRDLEETEHFRRWRQEEVAKIVQCGEQSQK
jgi:hypothetical protein